MLGPICCNTPLQSHSYAMIIRRRIAEKLRGLQPLLGRSNRDRKTEIGRNNLENLLHKINANRAGAFRIFGLPSSVPRLEPQEPNTACED
jgi:hypothetical protein